jgi:hypothetical protein
MHLSPTLHEPHDGADELPCAGGLLAGTLALMTAWAAPEPAARIDVLQQRRLMARKIVSNLFFLREHPALPPGLRMVVAKLHARWSEVAQSDATETTTTPAHAFANVMH